ncbi:MAG: hypothetical protein F9B45_05820 [Phycisphaera sp. RhM]|nr:hypothetical protein [Phycisphaera sp. RhM]
MKFSWINSTAASLLAGTLMFVGCGPSTEPTGPEEGSVQAYLDANPEAAARIDEDVDEGEDDGTGE